MARLKRTTLHLDGDLLAETSDVLGTSGTAETVHGAMRDVVRRRKLEQLAKREFPGMSLEMLEDLRRPRSFATDSEPP